ncbi:MAG: hypothetical protein HC888_03190 [Candidatus Competibacteraceae bacterium]|nr:hypothetical protein [Candidatus Competibacteraceae bacterium]
MATYRTGIAMIDVALAEAPETIDTHGNRSRKIFYHADRYLFDFKIDLSRWAQLDTSSDAWYFGIWVNKGKRQVLKYIEGDIYFVEADSDESYDAEIEALCRFHERRRRRSRSTRRAKRASSRIAPSCSSIRPEALPAGQTSCLPNSIPRKAEQRLLALRYHLPFKPA